MNFDIDKFLAITEEDYKNKFNDVINKVGRVSGNKLFIKLLNTDRMIIYSVLGNVMNSNCQVKHNRDELNFMSAIVSFISNYMLDDSEATIKWRKYDSDNGKFITSNETDPRGEPYIDHITNNQQKIAREDDVIKILEFHENKQLKYIEHLKELDMYDGSMDEKEYIDYNKKEQI